MTLIEGVGFGVLVGVNVAVIAWVAWVGSEKALPYLAFVGAGLVAAAVTLLLIVAFV